MANYDNRKSYNNQPLKDGETMIPVFIADKTMIRSYNMDRRNLETWRIGGVNVTVAFTPARIEQKELLMSVFWAEVREYVREQVQYFEHYSFEALTEWENEDKHDNSHHWDADVGIDTQASVLLRIAIDQLIEEVRSIDPVYGIILDLIRDGLEKREIVEILDYEKSQSYNKIREAQRKAKEIYDRW
ncbi:MAG: hypothetical protein J6N76_02220 [Lachnospiraceae bacterium]|nr:hypothetical protein [Lachnospiraceae bacterium]